MTGTCLKRPCARAQCIPMEHCRCECGGWGHNPAVELVRRTRKRRAEKKARTKAERAGRDQDRVQYRSLHPAEIMGGGLIAPRPRRARDVGGDEYVVAVQAWLDKLESSGHADDVPKARQGAFWRSARSGRGWTAQVSSAAGQRRGSSSRPLADWMKDNPRPRRADYRGRADDGDRRPTTKAERDRLERELTEAGW